MRLKRVEKFTKPVTKGLLPTQQATLSQVVCGLLICGSLLEAEIARCFETTVDFVHNLKRVFRFVDNERINEPENKEVVARRMIAQLRRRLELKSGEYLEVIIDWTSVGRYQVLSALIPGEGRAVAVLQWAVEKWKFEISQNATEEQFIQSLRRCIPKEWKTVVVADRVLRWTAFLRVM